MKNACSWWALFIAKTKTAVQTLKIMWSRNPNPIRNKILLACRHIHVVGYLWYEFWWKSVKGATSNFELYICWIASSLLGASVWPPIVSKNPVLQSCSVAVITCGTGVRSIPKDRVRTKDFSRQNLLGEMLWFRCFVPKVWRFGTPRFPPNSVL